MWRLLFTLPALALFSTANPIQLVSPPGWQDIEGDSASVPPFHLASSGTGFWARSQFFVASAAFAGYSEIELLEIGFRPDENDDEDSGSVLDDVEIVLAVAPAKLVDVSTVFAENYKTPPQTVYNGIVVIPPTSGATSPRPFWNIALAEPFVYRPSEGNLMVEIRNHGQSTNMRKGRVDATDRDGFECCCATVNDGSSGNPNAEFGYLGTGYCPIIQYTFNAIENDEVTGSTSTTNTGIELVAPTEWETQEAVSASNGPFYLNRNEEYYWAKSQYVFASSFFGATTDDSTAITEIGFRSDQDDKGATVTLDNVVILLGVTDRGTNELDENFDDNYVMPPKIVFEGSITIPEPRGPAPRPFWNVPLTESFQYKASDGNLVVEVRNYASPSSTRRGAVDAAANQGFNDYCTTVSDNGKGNPELESGVVEAGVCPVLRFGFERRAPSSAPTVSMAPVPSPSNSVIETSSPVSIVGVNAGPDETSSSSSTPAIIESSCSFFWVTLASVLLITMY